MGYRCDFSQLPEWLTAIGTIALAIVGFATAVGTFALAFVAAFQDQVRAFFRPAKLCLTFRQGPPMCRLSSRSYPSGLRQPFFDFHFRITNEGKSQARKVEAFLQRMWIYDAMVGTRTEIPDLFPVRLRYYDKETPSVDINPNGPPVFWNLAFIPSPVIQSLYVGESYVEPPGTYPPGHRLYLDVLDRPFFQPNTLPPGNYAIVISVYSENAARVDTYFLIHWTGAWQPTEAQMFREVTITQADKMP